MSVRRWLLAAALAGGGPGLAAAQPAAPACPALLASATRLVLVTAETMSTSVATLRRYRRLAAGAAWVADGVPEQAQIGRSGMGWSFAFSNLAASGEPAKVDGDGRAPAGIYRLGRSFGFGPSSRPRHLQIREGTVCIDDPSSPAYNTITARAKTGWKVSGENMWRISAYRNGLLVDYPTSRRARGGSCIFIHVRIPDATGTSGCVALPEPQVVALQNFSAAGATIAILPEQALGRFGACLPAIR